MSFAPPHDTRECLWATLTTETQILQAHLWHNAESLKNCTPNSLAPRSKLSFDIFETQTVFIRLEVGIATAIHTSRRMKMRINTRVLRVLEQIETLAQSSLQCWLGACCSHYTRHELSIKDIWYICVSLTPLLLWKSVCISPEGIFSRHMIQSTVFTVNVKLGWLSTRKRPVLYYRRPTNLVRASTVFQHCQDLKVLRENEEFIISDYYWFNT